MSKNKLKVLFVSIFFAGFVSCKTSPGKDRLKSTVDNKDDFYQVIDRHFHRIDSLNRIDVDQVETANMELQQALNQLKSEIFSLKDTLDYDLLYLVKSKDKKLCLVSWDTRLGGTMIEFTTMAFYKDSKGNIISEMLVDSSWGHTASSLMHYDRMYTIDTANDPIYIAHGFGQGSTALPWQHLKAFQIKGDRLTYPAIFPGSEAELFVEFNSDQLPGGWAPNILVKDSGRKIEVPIPDDLEGFSGKYQRLVFDGRSYTQE